MFQFQYGAIKSFRKLFKTLIAYKFQFQYGAIKSRFNAVQYLS